MTPDTTDTPRPARGGRRPGAGAPKGNTNALKHGVYSQRHLNAAILIAVLPDLQVYIRRLLREEPGNARRKHGHVMAAARYAILNHPALEGSIKQYVIYRLSAAAGQFDHDTPIAELRRELSNNQGYVGIMEDLEARRWLSEGITDLHPDLDYLLEVFTDLGHARRKKAVHDRQPATSPLRLATRGGRK